MTLVLAVFVLDLSPQVRGTKAKINKWDYINLKRLCTMKKIINKPEMLPTEQEKVFTNSISNNGLIFKIYKEFIQLNIKNKQFN